MYSYFLDNGVDGGALLCIEELPEWLSSSVYGVKIKFQKLMKDLFSRKISINSTVVSFSLFKSNYLIQIEIYYF
jgi:hypothetical protein